MRLQKYINYEENLNQGILLRENQNNWSSELIIYLNITIFTFSFVYSLDIMHGRGGGAFSQIPPSVYISKVLISVGMFFDCPNITYKNP